MFYISDINGVQQPYSTEAFKLLRQRQLEDAAALRAEAPVTYNEAGEIDGQENASVNKGNASIEPEIGDRSGASVSAVAAGLAGASMSKPAEKAIKTEPTDEGAFQAKTNNQVNQAHRSLGVKNDKQKADTYDSQANLYKRIDSEVPEREPAITAEQIMSKKVVTLNPDDTLGAAWQLFKARRFRHVPVISSSKRVIGILSDRDFLKYLTSKKIADDENIESSTTVVSTIMARNVLTARPATEIRLIAKIMFQERIGAMPVVDANEQLVGFLTRSDILRTVVNKAPLELWV